MKITDIEHLAEETRQDLLTYKITESNFKIDNNIWRLPNGKTMENNTPKLIYKVYRGIHYGIQGGDEIKVTGFKAKDFVGTITRKTVEEKTIPKTLTEMTKEERFRTMFGKQ